ncbi:MAG: hypothetical protein HY904_18615 [Deltaproteobacteria bacterium]|nr:hypothetical protein [Deltaproteobacteria bacterium]
MRAVGRALAALVLTALGSCSSSSDEVDCVDTSSGPDCKELCDKYCAKRRECGVNATSTCEEDCRTVTEAGASTESYQCVIRNACSEISNCGI